MCGVEHRDWQAHKALRVQQQDTDLSAVLKSRSL
jgi:hypothetical protein